MSSQKLESTYLIGIFVRTSNINSEALKDIPVLWERFMTENVAETIPNKLGSEIYCTYTEYEGDHMKPYTVLIGCPVANLDTIPDGMKGIEIPGGTYEKFQGKGNLMEGAVAKVWYSIWEQDLDRAYKADFEVYGEKAQDPTNAEFEIFIGLN